MVDKRSAEILRMSEDKTLEFVSLYAKEECLWKTDSKFYTNKTARSIATQRIAEAINLPEFEAKHVMIKFRNLRNSYCQELKKMAASIELGVEHKPRLIWFNLIDSFLRNYLKSPRFDEAIEKKLNERLDESVSNNNVCNHVNNNMTCNVNDVYTNINDTVYTNGNGSVNTMLNNNLNTYVNNNVNTNINNDLNTFVDNNVHTNTNNNVNIYANNNINTSISTDLYSNINNNVSNITNNNIPVVLVNPVPVPEEDEWYVIGDPEPIEEMYSEEDLSAISASDIMVDPLEPLEPLNKRSREENCIDPSLLNKDYFDDFGQYISSLLRALPLKKAMVLQPQIINMITTAAMEAD